MPEEAWDTFGPFPAPLKSRGALQVKIPTDRLNGCQKQRDIHPLPFSFELL
jgi:hypothetical protein